MIRRQTGGDPFFETIEVPARPRCNLNPVNQQLAHTRGRTLFMSQLCASDRFGVSTGGEAPDARRAPHSSIA